MYAGFAAQTYPNKHLYVLDESSKPSAFFAGLRDARVTYVHAPASRGDVTRIGAARNKLYAMVGEPLVAHWDDDDVYAPAYLGTMIGRLGTSDVAKLAVFNSLTPHGEVYQWDVRQMGGAHYALKGGEKPRLVDVPNPDPKLADALMLGFGFSYVVRKSTTWDRVKFPSEGTEDFPWMRELRQIGARIVHVDDYPEGVLHVVHAKSGSMLFPQRFLGTRRQLGLGANAGMTQLPFGKDVRLEPGQRYAVLASVHKKHTIKALAARCSTWGIALEHAQDNVDPKTFGASAPSSKDYRLIHATATAKTAATLPWTVPAPWSVFDESTLVKAWSSAPVVRSSSMSARPMFAGTTPGDVLAYRAMWNQYIVDTACALYVQSWAATQASSSGAVPTPAQLAAQAAKGTPATNAVACGAAWIGPTGKNITQPILTHEAMAGSLTDFAAASSALADSLMSAWNAFAGFDAATITLQAQTILSSLQNTVQSAGGDGRQLLTEFSPGLAAVISQGPDMSLQAKVVAQIEGAAIMAAGYLKVYSTTATGVINGAVTAAQEIAKQGKSVLGQTSWILSPWTWAIAATLVVGLAGWSVWNADKLAKFAPLAMEPMRPVVFRKRRR